MSGSVANLLFISRECDWVHHLARSPSLKSATATLIWRQEGRDGTKTRPRSCLRAGSCGGVGRPRDHDVGGPPPESRQFGCADPTEADDLPGSKLEFVLKVQALRNERLRVSQHGEKHFRSMGDVTVECLSERAQPPTLRGGAP